MPRYRQVAYISRAKGLIGEVVVNSVHNLSSHIACGSRLWVVPPDHNLVRETEVLAAKVEADEAFQILKLRDVEDRTTAQRLVGRYLLGLVEDYIWVDNDGDDNTAIGCTIIDIEGQLIGVVVEEHFGSAQTLWLVDGPSGEVLIPAVEQLIQGRNAQTITMSIPKGLLELNQNHEHPKQ